MRRLTALSLSISLLTPTLALAAFTSPSDVLRAIQNDASPHAYSMEVHGGAEGTYISMWAKGQYQGASILDATSAGTMTIDLAQPAEGVDARVRVRYMIADATLYLLLDDVRVSGANAAATLDASLQGKQWVRFDSEEMFGGMPPEEAMAVFGMGMGNMESLAQEFFNGMFAMTQRGLGADTEYTLTLRPDAADALMRLMAVHFSGVSPDDRVALRDALREMRNDPSMAELRSLLSKLNLRYVARLSKVNRLLRSTLSGDVTIEGVSVRFKGENTALASPVKVSVPTNVMTPEEFGAMLEDLSAFGDAFDAGAFGFPTMDEPTWEDESDWSTWEDESDDWSDDEWSWTEQDSIDAGLCDATDAQSLSALRKGQLCDNRLLRPSRR